MLPTTATLAVVWVTGQSPAHTLASSPIAMDRADAPAAAPVDSVAVSDLVATRSSVERAARDTERVRVDVIAAENARRAAQEAELAGTQLDVQLTTAQAPAGSAKSLPAPSLRSWVKPVNVSYVKTSGFGPRWGSVHPAQDFAMPVGSPLYAMSSGTIKVASWQGGYGYKIEIEFWDGTVAWYCHTSKLLVKVGQTVKPGDVIALSGNTGHSTGPHLHLEIHPKGGAPVNPMPWLSSHGLAM